MKPSLLPALLFVAACATSPEPIGFDAVVEDCARQDVVFFGELHPNDICHQQQLKLLKALHEKRPDIVVTMEMFERDVQEHLDRFLAGEIEEEEFRKVARAWANWRHYKPVVAYAAEKGIPVFAANAPVAIVRGISRGERDVASLAGEEHVAREVRIEQDAYYDAFVDAMSGDGHAMSESMKKAVPLFFAAQKVRDETMAETIADYLAAASKEGRKPLVLHLCGSFHSKDRMGTVSCLLRRDPSLAVRVIESEEFEAEWYSMVGGDFRLVAGKSVRPKMPDKHPEPKAKKQPEDEEPIDENARPGLGFMPVYDSDAEGCAVGMVVEGSAAEKAGIKEDDVIVELAGEEIDSVRAYSDVLGGLKIGKAIKVVVVRKGKRVELEAVVGVSRR